MRQTTKQLAARLDGLEETLRTIGTALKEIKAQLPLANENGAKVLQGLQDMLQDITTNGITTPRLTVVNKEGDPVACIGVSGGGHGVVSIRNAAGQVTAAMGTDGDDGTGGLLLQHADGRPYARIRAIDGAGRLDLIQADTGKAISYGL